MSDHHETVQKYLQRLLEYKVNKDLHDSYLNDEDREKLLRELFDSLEFDPHLWEDRKRNAKRHFIIAELYDEDSKLETIHPKYRKQKVCEHLKKAIALDPYNLEYLKYYINGSNVICDENEDYNNRLLCLHDPNSTEYQNMTVDFDLSSTINEYDYLADAVLHPFVDELVFIKENPDLQAKNAELLDQELKEIAKSGGIDEATIKDAEKHLETHLKTAGKVFDYWWKSWDEALKAWMSMQKAVDIAPYNKEVLELAVAFYGNFFWRLILGYSKAPKSHKNKQFFKKLFGKEKLNAEELKEEVFKSIEKADAFQKRYAQIIAYERENNKEDDNWTSRFHRSVFTHDIMDLFGTLDYRKDKDAHLNALVVKETEVAAAFIAHSEMIRQNTKFVIIVGAIVFLVVGYTAYVLFPLFLGVLFPLFITAMCVLGLVELRKKWWQRKPLKLLA
ncbi:MAG: hypothetical protein WDZ35_09740 [Crocinitomicaceae bacterium]